MSSKNLNLSEDHTIPVLQQDSFVEISPLNALTIVFSPMLVALSGFAVYRYTHSWGSKVIGFFLLASLFFWWGIKILENITYSPLPEDKISYSINTSGFSLWHILLILIALTLDSKGYQDIAMVSLLGGLSVILGKGFWIWSKTDRKGFMDLILNHILIVNLLAGLLTAVSLQGVVNV